MKPITNFTENEILIIKGQAAGLSLASELLDIDIFGLLVEATRPVIQRRTLRRGKPATAGGFAMSDALAIEAVMEVEPKITYRAGVTLSVSVPVRAHDLRIVRVIGDWRRLVLHSALVARKRGTADARQAWIVEMYDVYNGFEFVDGDAMLGDLRAGRGLALTSATESSYRQHDPNEKCAEERKQSELGDFGVVASTGTGLPGVFFVGDDFRLRLGKRQVRDRLAKEYKSSLPMRAAHLEAPIDGEDEQHDSRVMGAADIAEAADAARAVRSAVEARLKQARAGSGRFQILQNFDQVAQGELTLTELASSSGLAVSTLHEAKEQVLADLRRLLAG